MFCPERPHRVSLGSLRDLSCLLRVIVDENLKAQGGAVERNPLFEDTHKQRLFELNRLHCLHGSVLVQKGATGAPNGSWAENLAQGRSRGRTRDPSCLLRVFVDENLIRQWKGNP